MSRHLAVDWLAELTMAYRDALNRHAKGPEDRQIINTLTTGFASDLVQGALADPEILRVVLDLDTMRTEDERMNEIRRGIAEERQAQREQARLKREAKKRQQQDA